MIFDDLRWSQQVVQGCVCMKQESGNMSYKFRTFNALDVQVGLLFLQFSSHCQRRDVPIFLCGHDLENDVFQVR